MTGRVSLPWAVEGLAKPQTLNPMTGLVSLPWAVFPARTRTQDHFCIEPYIYKSMCIDMIDMYYYTMYVLSPGVSFGLGFVWVLFGVREGSRFQALVCRG